MRILMISSEATPFAKTGGLADVAGSLPLALRSLGHDVRLILPLYASVDRMCHRLFPLLRRMEVRWGNETITGGLMRTSHPGDGVTPVYFVQQEALYNRRGLYNEGGRDYPDNDRRFGFFCLAAFWAMKGLDWQPDVLHLNDWQTGAAAALLRRHPEISSDSFFQGMGTVFTIHNMAYQGIVGRQFLDNLRLPADLFHPDACEFHDRVSLLKTGIALADRVTTVSPTYAREIQEPEEGMGLDGLLRSRSGALHGILNGIDATVWDPSSDPYLPAHFTMDDLSGKAACKEALRSAFRISAAPEAPHFGIVSRLVDQKGFDLLAEVAPALVGAGATLSVLGTGDPRYEDFFLSLADQYPGQVGAVIAYREDLAHLIEAGSDFFLMPSRFEPSGLNQLYSMRYGTIPIVRRVGGLADSVADADADSIDAGSATGFVFDEYTSPALYAAVRRGLDLYRRDATRWLRLVRNAMSRESSWEDAAGKYVDVYRLAAADAR